MAASSIAKRNATRAAPKISAVESSTEWHPIKARARGHSNISGLLALGGTLPMSRYDPARMGEVLSLDSDGKQELLGKLDDVTSGVNRAIAQIGMLLAGQDESMGLVDHDGLVEIGFTIDGLGNLAEELMCIRNQIENTEAQAVGHIAPR